MPLYFTPAAQASASFVDTVAMIGDAIRNFVWVAGSSGEPVYQNRESLRYTGQTTESLGAVGWSALCHPDDRDQFENAWNAGIGSGSPFQVEFRCRRHDGAYYWMLCQVTPVYTSSGERTHFFATLTDVHRHRLLETELHRSVKNRDEFLATFVHEVRSPLQAIGQAVSVAQSPQATPELVSRMHALIDRQLNVLRRFTEESLDLSRVRWNAMSLLPSSVKLHALVAAAHERARPTIESAGVELDIEITDPECDLIADASRMAQALSNVLGNAARHSLPGGRVQLRVMCEDGEAVFEVRDWGSGIEPDRLHAIFELFTRAPRLAQSQTQAHTQSRTRSQTQSQTPSHTQAQTDGLGVGLAVALHVAQMHGGTLIAASDGLERGSCFTLRIPLAASPRG